MTWNPRAGGFNSYQSTASVPEREADVMSFIHSAKQEHLLGAVTIPDAFRWRNLYNDDQSLARKLGFAAARYVLLDDDKLNHDEGKDIGIAFVTDQLIQSSEVIDLNTRNGLNVILDVGRDGIQIASAYLDHDDEASRLVQARALASHVLKNNIPTIIQGDLNGLQNDLGSARLTTKLKDAILKLIIGSIPEVHLPKAAIALNKRQAVPYLQSQGFINADRERRPTWPSILPIVEVDYILHTADIRTTDTKVLKPGTSDHRAVITSASVIA